MDATAILTLHMSYYTEWGKVIGTPHFQKFLRKNYELGLADLKSLGHKSPFTKSVVHCLLCGVGNAATAKTFITFVIEQNPQAKITIIDLGEEQFHHVRALVTSEFPNPDITVKQMDALRLKDVVKDGSVDWIETDGFLEFFDDKQLRKLLSIWYDLLDSSGYISIREPASNGLFGSIIDWWRIRVAWWWVKIRIHNHTLADLDRLFSEAGFKHCSEPTSVPTFRRFTMVKQKN